MADTTYTAGVTSITSDTMGDLNRLHYTILSDPADAAAVNTALGYVSSSFTGTLTGCTTSPTATIYYTKHNNIITIMLDSASSLTGTSNATTKTITGMPAAARPARTVNTGFTALQDNGGTFAVGLVSIAATGVITLSPQITGGNWTASGTFTMQPFSVSYTLA